MEIGIGDGDSKNEVFTLRRSPIPLTVNIVTFWYHHWKKHVNITTEKQGRWGSLLLSYGAGVTPHSLIVRRVEDLKKVRIVVSQLNGQDNPNNS